MGWPLWSILLLQKMNFAQNTTGYFDCRLLYMQFYAVPGQIYAEMVFIATIDMFRRCMSRWGHCSLLPKQKSNLAPNPVGHVDCRWPYMRFYTVPGQIYWEMVAIAKNDKLGWCMSRWGPLWSLLPFKKSYFAMNTIGCFERCWLYMHIYKLYFLARSTRKW